jgi:hypothetical protein
MEKSSSEASRLNRILKRATEKALREAKALDLPVTYLEEGKIIQEFPNGEKKIIRETAKKRIQVGHKKGTILHVKK